MPRFHVNTQNKKMVWLELLLLTALCLTQYLGISSLNLLFTILIGCYMMLTKSLDDTTFALIVAFPLFNFFCATAGENRSWYYLYIFIFWYKYLKHNKWQLDKLKLIVLVALLAIRLTAGVTIDALMSTSTWFVLLSVFVLTYNEDCLNGQLLKIVKYVTIVFIISSVFGYIMFQNGHTIYTTGHVYSQGETTLRFHGILGDSVFYSQVCALFIGCNLALGYYNKKYLFTGITMSAILIWFSLLTYAKTGLVLIAIEIIAFVLWTICKNVKRKRTIIYSILIVIAFIAAIIWLINYLTSGDVSTLVQNYFVRFTSNDLLTNRLEIWNHYFDMMLSSWRSLFCALPHSVFTETFMTESGHLLNTTHNIYIETLCAFGLIASILMMIWLFVVIFRSIMRRDGMLNLMPLGVILASGVVLHGHFDFHFYLILSIAIAFATYGRNNKGLRMV